jgi:hypothetical protein
MAKTKFMNRCHILADFYVEYKGDEKFQEFFSYSDLGLPLAYAISSGIVQKTEIAKGFVNEAFQLLLEILGIEEEESYETLEDILPYIED